MAEKITVISCSPDGWISSSEVMGRSLAEICGTEKAEVIPCRTKRCFLDAFEGAGKHVLIHTHGSSVSLFDELDGREVRIISSRCIALMKPNRNIEFVFITACKTAGGHAKRNIASRISKKISKDGIVIANLHKVVGGDTVFSSANKENGWRAYRNGKLVSDVEDIPVSLTVKEAYSISKKGLK